MSLNKVFIFLFTSVVYWFLCGGPNFVEHPASAGLYAIALLYLAMITWNKQLFYLFNGDLFTYGAAGQGIAIAVGLPAVTISAFFIRVDSNIAEVPTWIGKIGIGFLLLGILLVASIPILSTNDVTTLPQVDSRRLYEDSPETPEEPTNV